MTEKITPKIKLTYVTFIFLFIFAPPIVPKINFVIVLFGYALYKLVTKHRKKVMHVISRSGGSLYIKLMFFSWIYLLVIMFFGYLFDAVNISNYLTTWYRFFMIFPIVFVCIFYIIIVSESLGYRYTELLRAIIYAGLLQALITVLMLIFSPFREVLLKIAYINTGDELTQNLWHLQRRYYAFSHSMLDTFGFGTGLIASVSFMYALITKKSRYFVFSIILLVVPLFNSRTGLVVFLIGMFLSIFLLLRQPNVRGITRVIIVASGLSIILYFSYDFLLENFSTTIAWAESGISDFFAFFTGGSGDDSVSVITSSEKWFLPDSFWIFTGTGHNVFEAQGYAHSDVGYVNDIWLAGIVGSIFIYLPITVLFLKALLIADKSQKILLLFLIISFYVANVKTIILNYNVGTSCILLIVLFMIYEKRKKGRDFYDREVNKYERNY